ncbi:MAG: class I SAM-dependent methyltransferase [Bacteroidales bacterium]
MKNSEKWQASQIICNQHKFAINTKSNYIWAASILATKLKLYFYAKYIPLHTFGNLIDLGCGQVPLYQIYKPYTLTQTCVDWENSLHKNELLDFNCNLNQKLPIKDNTYDTVILSDVLEHIQKPQQLLNDIHRILTTKGVLLLNVPFYYGIHESPYDYYRYTEFALKDLLTTAGFINIQIFHIGGILDVWADITAKLLIRIPLIGKIMAKIIQFLVSIFGKTKIGQKIRKGTSPSAPLGYFCVVKKS